MPTHKIRELTMDEACRDPDHKPPGHYLFEPGVYEHVCPSCGKRIEFTVRDPGVWRMAPPPPPWATQIYEWQRVSKGWRFEYQPHGVMTTGADVGAYGS